MGPGAVTVAAIDFAWTSVPLVPVMVTVYDPAFVALNVHVDVCDPLMLEGTHAVVTPAGAEAAVRLTVPVKPPVAVRLTIDVADPPDPNETLVGFAAIPKSGPPARKNSRGDGAFTSP